LNVAWKDVAAAEAEATLSAAQKAAIARMA
jgi:hypothetical protein